MLTNKLRNAFGAAFAKIRNGELRTLIPFLSLFRLNGQPMGLKLHYQFAPMYNTVQAPHTVWMCGRQLGKSYALASDTGIRNSIVPYYHTLLIQPRFDQIQRFNGTIFQPFIRSSTIQQDLISNLELSKMSLKLFKNGSMCYFEHMFTTPDRIRGISGVATCVFDEAQDIDYEYLNIANETMSASLFWGFSRYTGTPKTTDTTLALLWDRSSKCEWVIKCTHCGFQNIPNPEQHLLKMIGTTGPVCAKCSKSVDPKNGHYVPAIQDLALSFPGYHISQTIHPLHVVVPNKWRTLLYKLENYTEQAVYNEIFGWPYDAAVSPLTLADLQNTMHTLQRITKPSDIEPITLNYRYITVSVDWSGGGTVSDSYTSFAVLGLRNDSDVIDVLYGERIRKGTPAAEEARIINDWIAGVGADSFAYDNGGAGFARLEIMNHEGLRSIPNLLVMPINYVRPRAGDVMKPRTGMREADLYYYTLDKSRSLAVCIMALKSKRVQLPAFKTDDAEAYQRDFLALREDPITSYGCTTTILITKKPGVPDDFAHAVNFGCSQIWDHFGAYPKIGTRYDTADFEAPPAEYDEFANFGPRGDFDRFQEALEMRATVIQPNMGMF